MEKIYYVPIPEDEYFSRIADAIYASFQRKSGPEKTSGKKWLNHGEAAEYIMKTKAALYKLSSEKKVKFSKRGKQNYYRIEDLDAYMEDGFVKTEKEIISESTLMPKRNFRTLKK